MSPEEIVRFIQAAVALSTALVVLAFHQRLAAELAERFASFYGSIFNAETFFKSKWMLRYFKLVIVCFGLGALAFALTALFGPR